LKNQKTGFQNRTETFPSVGNRCCRRRPLRAGAGTAEISRTMTDSGKTTAAAPAVGGDWHASPTGGVPGRDFRRAVPKNQADTFPSAASSRSCRNVRSSRSRATRNGTRPSTPGRSPLRWYGFRRNPSRRRSSLPLRRGRRKFLSVVNVIKLFTSILL